MLIRPETPADFAAVADINIQAFGRNEEAVIVALLRQRPSYTPQFSLVAEEDGKLLGHALFTPAQVVYAGKLRPMIVLAPIAVHPSAQKQGIGGALLQEGHRIAQEHGFEAAMLLGHPSYYPRFGYQTQQHGSSSLAIQTASLPANELETRAPLASDIPALMALWEYEEGRVEFALRPDAHLTDWLSPNTAIKTEVYLQNGEIVGYSRSKGLEIRAFYAKTVLAAQMMATYLAGESASITLPLHPISASAPAFSGSPKVQAWEAGMCCPLQPDLPASSIAGRVIWPTAFDLA
jgi:putative acetyltransferase